MKKVLTLSGQVIYFVNKSYSEVNASEIIHVCYMYVCGVTHVELTSIQVPEFVELYIDVN